MAGEHCGGDVAGAVVRHAVDQEDLDLGGIEGLGEDGGEALFDEFRLVAHRQDHRNQGPIPVLARGTGGWARPSPGETMGAVARFHQAFVDRSTLRE